MAFLFIRARGPTFRSSDLGAEYERPEAALALGLNGAVAMLTDDLRRGEANAAVEISVEAQDGTQVLCSVVTLSVCALTPRTAEAFTADSVES